MFLVETDFINESPSCLRFILYNFKLPPSEKCPYTEFFLVVFLHIWTEYSVKKTEKYGPGKSPYLDTFYKVYVSTISIISTQQKE